jgi:protein gp37
VSGKLDWIVAGGESGPGARPMHPDWARSLRDQCAAAGVPFLFKQWGEFKPYEDERADCFWLDPNGHVYGGPTNWPPLPDEPRAAMCRVGKKAAGRLLDGVEHNEFPA